MKKYIILAVFLLLPSISYASFDRNLKIGMGGNDVSELQDILTESGCFNHASTGYFGLVTFNSVKCFQSKNNLPSTGYVGQMTRGVLNNLLSDAVQSSNQAELSETGSTTATFVCPTGYVCSKESDQTKSIQDLTKEVSDLKTAISSTQPKLGAAETPSTIAVGESSCREVPNGTMSTKSIRPYVPIITTGKEPAGYRLTFKNVNDPDQSVSWGKPLVDTGHMLALNTEKALEFPTAPATYEYTLTSYSRDHGNAQQLNASVIAHTEGRLDFKSCE